MPEIIAALSLIGALFLLFLLSRIDLKEGILPNELVFTFLVLGLAFHISTAFAFVSEPDMLYGALTGGGVLLLIRMAANWYYKDDTLGMGDVKLLGAAGVWLGPYGVLTALMLGAAVGTLHGIGLALDYRVRHKGWPDFTKLSLPAGPGFAVGIVLAGGMLLHDFVVKLFL